MKNLQNFFCPKSIALIGASENNSKVGGILINKLIKSKIKIFPINPNYSKIKNISTFSSVLKVKPKIDLAIIAIPALAVPKTLEECGKKKIKSLIIISAGFSEEKNYDLQNKINQISKKYSINYIGPNCFGIANTKNNIDTTFSKATAKRGKIAFISQSGALWSYIADSTKEGISKFISLGNQEDLTFSDFIEYLQKDKETKKIVCYIEKLKDGKKFIEICKKSKKPIYVLKAGKTKTGETAAISHTASIASEYKIYEGAFKQAKVNTIEYLEDIFKIPIKIKPIVIKKTDIITNAGGAGTLISDILEKNKIQISPPKDILGTAQPEEYEKEIKKNKEKKIVILTNQSMSNPLATAKIISKNKNCIALFLGKQSMKEANKILKKNKINVYNTIKEFALSLK